MKYTKNISPNLQPIEDVAFGSVILYKDTLYLVLDMWNIADVSTKNTKKNYVATLNRGCVINIPWGTKVEIIENS